MPRSPGVKPTARAPHPSPTGAGLRSLGGCWLYQAGQRAPHRPVRACLGSGEAAEPRQSQTTPRAPQEARREGWAPSLQAPQAVAWSHRQKGREERPQLGAGEMEVGACSPTVTETRKSRGVDADPVPWELEGAARPTQLTRRARSPEKEREMPKAAGLDSSLGLLSTSLGPYKDCTSLSCRRHIPIWRPRTLTARRALDRPNRPSLEFLSLILPTSYQILVKLKTEGQIRGSEWTISRSTCCHQVSIQKGSGVVPAP